MPDLVPFKDDKLDENIVEWNMTLKTFITGLKYPDSQLFSNRNIHERIRKLAEEEFVKEIVRARVEIAG